jgi:hypothetical protein
MKAALHNLQTIMMAVLRPEVVAVPLGLDFLQNDDQLFPNVLKTFQRIDLRMYPKILKVIRQAINDL